MTGGAQVRSGRERIALIVCVAFGCALFVASLQYPVTSGGRVGPGMYPLAVAVVIVVSAAVSFAFPQRHGAQSVDIADEDDSGDHEFGDAAWRVPLLVGVLIAYLVVVEYLGHMITSCLLAWVGIRIAGSRPWWQQVAIALALGIGTAELFARIGVPLPLGELLS